MPPVKSENPDTFLKNNDIKDLIIEDFPDGTMINLFKYEDELFISTRSVIGAHCKWTSKKTFNILFNESINLEMYNFIDNMSLSFVLQHPENRIVTKYLKPHVTLVKVAKIVDNNVTVFNPEQVRDFIIMNNLNIISPRLYNINNKEQINVLLNNMNNSTQGIVLKNYNNNSRTKIVNTKYEEIKNLKGNNNNKKYLYLELRKNNKLNDYLKYFSEDSELFNIFKIELYSATTQLFNFYQDFFVKRKLNTFLDIDYEYRPLCNELHFIYTHNQEIITKKRVIKYIKDLPISRLLFVLNYKLKN